MTRIFRKPHFSVRLLVSVLATLIAVEPLAFAKTSAWSSRWITTRGVDLHPEIGQVVTVIPGHGFPYDGKIDQFHSGTGAAAATKDWESLTSPNASAFMYALRNTAVLAALEHQMGLRYLIGGEQRAYSRSVELRKEFTDAWADQFVYRRAPDVHFGLTGDHARELFSGSGTPTPKIEFADEWLRNSGNDPILPDEAIEEIHRNVIPYLVERSLQLVQADVELKYYYHDYWAADWVKDGYTLWREGQAREIQLHKTGNNPGQMQQSFNGSFASEEYKWNTETADEYGPNGKLVDFPLPRFLRGSRAEIVAAHTQKTLLSDSPLLTVEIPHAVSRSAPFSWFSFKRKEQPLYSAIYDVLREEMQNQGYRDLELPDQRKVRVPDNAHVPAANEAIPPPDEFIQRLEYAKRNMAGTDPGQLYKRLVDNPRVFKRLHDLIDAGVLSYLNQTQKLMQHLTQRRDWDGDLGSQWANLVFDTGIVARTMHDYSYFGQPKKLGSPERSPSSTNEGGKSDVNIDMDRAESTIFHAVDRHQLAITKRINEAFMGLAGVEAFALIGSLVFEPESAPVLSAITEFISVWQISLILAFGGVVLSFERWRMSDLRKEVMESGYLIAPDGSFDSVQSAQEVAESDWRQLSSNGVYGFSSWILRLLGVGIIQGVRSARKLLVAEKGLQAIEDGADDTVRSLEAQGAAGQNRIKALRKVLQGPLGSLLPRFKAALGVVGKTLKYYGKHLFSPVMVADLGGSIATQMWAEYRDPLRDLSKSDGQIDAINDVATSAVYTIALNLALAKAARFSKKVLPSNDMWESSGEMNGRVAKFNAEITNPTGRWTIQQRLLSAALFHLTACPVGYVSGVTGDLATQIVKNRDRLASMVDGDSLRDAFSEANDHGVFLCAYAQWTAVRMQMVRGLNAGIRRGMGGRNVYTEKELDEGPKVEFPNADPSNVKWLKGGYFLGGHGTALASNILGSLTYAMLSRALGAEKPEDTSAKLPGSGQNPEAFGTSEADKEEFAMLDKLFSEGRIAGFTIEKRVDPVGDVLGALAGVFPLAPLPGSILRPPFVKDHPSAPESRPRKLPKVYTTIEVRAELPRIEVESVPFTATIEPEPEVPLPAPGTSANPPSDPESQLPSSDWVDPLLAQPTPGCHPLTEFCTE